MIRRATAFIRFDTLPLLDRPVPDPPLLLAGSFGIPFLYLRSVQFFAVALVSVGTRFTVKDMRIEDVIPQRPEFILSSSGKTYELRLPSIEDRIWFRQRFKEAEVKAAFDTRDWNVLSVIVMRLLKDRSDFAARDIEEIDEEGEKRKVRLSGSEILRRSILSTEDETQVICAINSAFANADPIVRKQLESALKKNLKTGPQSSTDSPTTTDGHSTTSEASP